MTIGSEGHLRKAVLVFLLVVASSALFSFLVLSFIFFPLSTLSSSSLNHKNEKFTKTDDMNEKYQKYRMIRVNNDENDDFSFGSISIKKELDLGDFFSFKDTDGADTMIFNLGNHQPYRCQGSCVCVEDERRASTSTRVLLGGLTYLVAAFTTSSAYNLAKGYFWELCEQHFDISQSCPRSRIRSEVESCFSFDSDVKDPGQEISTLEQEISKSKKRSFFCEGKCDLHYRTYRSEKEEISDHVKLFNIEMDHQGGIDFASGVDLGDGPSYIDEEEPLFMEPVEGELEDICKLHSITERIMLERSDFEDITANAEGFEMERMAKMKFLEKRLKPFCHAVKLGRDILPLIWDFEVLAPEIDRDSEELSTLFDRFRLCAPHPHNFLNYKDLLDSIKCI